MNEQLTIYNIKTCDFPCNNCLGCNQFEECYKVKELKENEN